MNKKFCGTRLLIHITERNFAIMAFNIKENVCDVDINMNIEKHIPFILKTISNITKRYVSVENDEEFSIGILAFKEAMDRYDVSRGEFLPFAQLVIESRLKSYLRNKSKYNKEVSLEKLEQLGFDIIDDSDYVNSDRETLQDEINEFKHEISLFGFSLDDLVEEAPKHFDTRENAIYISKKVNGDEEIKDVIFQKKRLPIRKISKKYNITEKVLKHSKKFILSVVIILNKPYRNLKQWISRR